MLVRSASFSPSLWARPASLQTLSLLSNRAKDSHHADKATPSKTNTDASKTGLSFFEGGSGFGDVKDKIKSKDPLNIETVRVPWVEDWFRTRQGAARVLLIANMTRLTPDEVQLRLSRILSIAPGLQEIVPLLHPTLFSSIISNIGHTFEVLTMFKAELPSIDLGIMASGFPKVLTWDRKVIYDCLCFLVVHFKGRNGAAEALNKHPMRLKYLRQLLPVLFEDYEQNAKIEARMRKRNIIGRLYQFNKHRKQTDSAPRQRMFYFEKTPVVRE